jgi:hypothetical protein
VVWPAQRVQRSGGQARGGAGKRYVLAKRRDCIASVDLSPLTTRRASHGQRARLVLPKEFAATPHAVRRGAASSVSPVLFAGGNHSSAVRAGLRNRRDRAPMDMGRFQPWKDQCMMSAEHTAAPAPETAAHAKRSVYIWKSAPPEVADANSPAPCNPDDSANHSARAPPVAKAPYILPNALA